MVSSLKNCSNHGKELTSGQRCNLRLNIHRHGYARRNGTRLNSSVIEVDAFLHLQGGLNACPCLVHLIDTECCSKCST